MIIHIAILLVGVFACCTAVIIVKASTIHPALLAAFRLLVAAAVLAPLYFRDRRRHRLTYKGRHLAATLAPAIALGIHFTLWIIGARRTTAANATLIVNMMPLVMPFYLYAFFRERITPRELIATLLALAATVCLTAGDFHLGHQTVIGDLACLAALLLLTYYLVLSRKNRHIPTLWLYLVPTYCFAGLLCLLISLFFVNPLARPYPPREILLILTLGIVPTVIGHSIFNYAMRHLRGQIVALVNLAQVAFAGALGYLFFRELPTTAFYIATPLLAAALLVPLYQNKNTR